jgi:hypothetical protein
METNIYVSQRGNTKKRAYVGSIKEMVSKVQKWMLENGLDPKCHTRGHKTVDFPGLESGSTSINEVSRDNAGRLVRAIKLRNLGTKGPFGDKSDEDSASEMWAWYYYHKTLALAPRAKHSITVPTVSYAIDMLQLLSKQQEAIQTTIEPETYNDNGKKSSQSTKEPQESNQQEAYIEIKLTLKKKNNTNTQGHPKQNSREKRRLQAKHRRRKTKRHKQQKQKTKTTK